jgi:hypothetical protein
MVKSLDFFQRRAPRSPPPASPIPLEEWRHDHECQMTTSGPDFDDGNSSLCQCARAGKPHPSIPPSWSNLSTFSIGARRATPHVFCTPRRGRGVLGIGGTGISACAAGPSKRQPHELSIGPRQRATTRNGALWKEPYNSSVFGPAPPQRAIWRIGNLWSISREITQVLGSTPRCGALWSAGHPLCTWENSVRWPVRSICGPPQSMVNPGAPGPSARTGT